MTTGQAIREPEELKGSVFAVVELNYRIDRNDDLVPDGYSAIKAVYSSRIEAHVVCERLNLRGRIIASDIFELCDRPFDDCISLPWPQWQDHLEAHGIKLPWSDYEDDHPIQPDLVEWWDSYHNGWNYTVGTGWVLEDPRDGCWTLEQQTEAARYVKAVLYEVVSNVPIDPDVIPG